MRIPRPHTWLGWLGLALVAYLLAAGAMLLLAKSRAERGLDALEHARDTLTTKDLLAGRGDPALAAAGTKFHAAHSLTHSIVLAPVRWMPVVGRQVRAIDALAGAAGTVSDVARSTVDQASEQLAGGLPKGEARVTLLRHLSSIAGVAAARLDKLKLGPSDALIGPVERAHKRFTDEFEGLRDNLHRAAVSAQDVATVLQGPSTYLLLAANNAEMRVGSGMYLSVGTVSMNGGNIDIGDVGPVTDVIVPPGVPITDPDLAAHWSFTDPTVEWRDLGFTPRFDVSADMAARMWVAAGRPPVDGVLAVDVVALRSLLVATGPVQAGTTTVDSGNVIGLLLHDQYAGLTQEDNQSARRELLASVAKAVVQKVDSGAADLATLADQLRSASRSRHLFAWASNATLDRGWQAARLEGALAPDSLLVSVANQGGNKLDQYLDIDAALAVAPARAGLRRTTLTLTLTNKAPKTDSPYILGADPTVGPGVYPGFVTLELPRYVNDLHWTGGIGLVTRGTDGPTSLVLSVAVHVAPGAPQKISFTFTVPDPIQSLRIEPSARVPSIHWTTPGGVLFSDGDGARTVDIVTR